MPAKSYSAATSASTSATGRDAGTLDAALRYAAAGFPVLPVHGFREDGSCTCGRGCGKNGGKHPWTRHGFNDATIDPVKIRHWWARKLPANVGIRTGDGLAVLDVDVHGADGFAMLAALEAQHGPLPDTATAATGGGGTHYFFRVDRPVRSRVLGPGLELKGEDAFVVVEPSLHRSGHCYAWLTSPPAGLEALPLLPGVLIERPDPIASRDDENTLRASGLPPWLPTRIEVGQRHRTLVRLAGWLRGCGRDAGGLRRVLAEVVRERVVQPANDRIADAWLEQLVSTMAKKRALGRHALAGRCETIARTWLGRRGRADRRVFLGAVVPMCGRAFKQKQQVIPMAVRTVALLASVKPKAASMALKRLAGERGVLRHAGQRSDDETAARYRLVLPRSSRPDTEQHSYHSPLRGDSVSRRDNAAAHDLFRHGGLGWVAGEVYATLRRNTGQSVGQIVRSTGAARASVYRVLAALKRQNLSVKGADGWRRGPASLHAVAKRRGVLGQYDRDRAQYREERETYHSEEGRRRRDAAREQRGELRASILNDARAHGFPAVLDIESGETAWRRFVRRAQSRRLVRIGQALARRRRPREPRSEEGRRAGRSRTQGRG